MRTSFYLDKPTEERSAIMLNVAFHGQRFRFGTGVAMSPKHWNAPKQEPRATSPTVNVDRRRLNAILEFVRTLFDSTKFGDRGHVVTQTDLAEFKQSIVAFLSPPPAQQPIAGSTNFEQDFNRFIDTYTLRSKSGMITTQRPSIRTLQLYKRTLSSLLEWSVFEKRPLEYDSIDEDFYGSYCNWLAKHVGLTDASAGNHIKVLKTFMKWARLKALHNTLTYETFYRDKRTGDTIALTVDELRRFRDLDLSHAPRLARTRDIFLLQCYTGMRYGDLIQLEPRHFDDSIGLIQYVSEKTDTACIVPITQPLRRLLERYPSRIIEFPSDVKQNKYIKEVAALVSMDQSVSVSHYISGKRREQLSPRHQLVTTQVARRTYVTTSLRFGVPEAVINAVTGHAASTIQQKHYVKFDNDGIRDIICRAWEQL